MQVLYRTCAGLDVHKRTVVVCHLQVAATGAVQREVRTFGTMTAELLELVDWLQAGEVTHVAMESTGDYWKPVFNLLEGNVDVLLVNAQHVKHVPGRKTDVQDAEWLAELLSYGLLKPSFIPAKPPARLARSDPLPSELGGRTRAADQSPAKAAGRGEYQTGLGGQ